MDIDKFISVVPTSERNLKRLKFLVEKASKPRVAVFGKYNHGKSTLLNAINGEEVFKAADKRETIKNSDIEHNDIIWVDTPGLDADVNQNDDKAALKGAFEVADFIFLVHQVTAGELDKYEMNIFQQLAKQDKNYSKKMFLILTQVDQKKPDELALVQKTIQKQLQNNLDLQDLNVISVSASRYLKGLAENKPIFCEKSGMDEVFKLSENLKIDIQQLRNKESKRLKDKLRIELIQKRKQVTDELISLKYRQKANQKSFDKELSQFLVNVTAKA